MEGRMTICNMSIEAGARAGMIRLPTPRHHHRLPQRPPLLLARRRSVGRKPFTHWSELAAPTKAPPSTANSPSTPPTSPPPSSWGTSPGEWSLVSRIHRSRPCPTRTLSEADQKNFERALEYMDLKAGTPIDEIAVDCVFLGSLHQRPHRRPPRRRLGRPRLQGRDHRSRDGLRPRLAEGQSSSSRTGRPR